MSKIQISLEELDSITEIDKQAAETISGGAPRNETNCHFFYSNCLRAPARCPRGGYPAYCG